MEFNYKARGRDGKAISGVMEAADADELTQLLIKRGLVPIRVTQRIALPSWLSFIEEFARVDDEDLIFWNLQLSNLVGAGINLLASLESLREQTVNRSLKHATEGIAQSVRAGESFSQGLSGYPRIFSKLFVKMVQAGETSGKLDFVLLNWASYSEKELDLKQKVQSAFAYPVILMVLATCVVLFVVINVIPQFVELFAGSGVPLPLPTQIVYSLGIFLKANWPALAVFSASAFGMIKVVSARPQGALFFDGIKIRSFIIGTLLRRIAISRFTRTLSVLVSSGIPILESLRSSAGVVDNAVIHQAILKAEKSVEKGERIGASLKATGEFPADTVQMISSGEESGTLDDMLNRLADAYDRYIAYSFRKLTIVLEPVLLLILGTVVAFIMLSTILPMLDLVSVIKGR